MSVDDLPRLRAERTVTQALLVEGRNRARIYEPAGSPPDGFASVPVTLEDAYLVLMRLGDFPTDEPRAGRAAQRDDALSPGSAPAEVAG